MASTIFGRTNAAYPADSTLTGAASFTIDRSLSFFAELAAYLREERPASCRTA